MWTRVGKTQPNLYIWQNFIWIILFIVVEYWTFKANKGNLLFNYHISILYYSIGFTDLALKFWRQISKSGFGASKIRPPILLRFSGIFSLMFFIIKPNVENKFKTCVIFYATIHRGEVENKIYTYPVLFLFVLCFLVATNTLFKKTRKIIMI